MQVLTTIPDTLQVVVSDLGDGGWSLHDARDTDEMIAEGDSPVLASGDGSVLLMDVDHALARLAKNTAHTGAEPLKCQTCTTEMFAKIDATFAATFVAKRV
jgi:hypothetical protein